VAKIYYLREEIVMEQEKKPFNAIWIVVGFFLFMVLIVLFEIFFKK
jgi:hypothetical protein